MFDGTESLFVSWPQAVDGFNPSILPKLESLANFFDALILPACLHRLFHQAEKNTDTRTSMRQQNGGGHVDDAAHSDWPLPSWLRMA